MRRDPVVVIGAGVGGLSAAIHLAAAGERVVVFEQNAQVGGKMGEICESGYRWDTGPSLITMRDVFEDLFHYAGKKLEDYIHLQPIKPLGRFFYSNGPILDVTHDVPSMFEQIRQIAPNDISGYSAFLSYVSRLYQIVGPVFIFNEPPSLNTMLRVSPWEALRFDGFRSMSEAIRSFVHSVEIRQLLERFATYVGSNPFRTPATLNVIAHVELNQGVWYPRTGIFAIARAMKALAQELGIEIYTKTRVDRIVIKDGHVVGVQLIDGEKIPASAVVANLDVALVHRNLLASESWSAALAKKIERAERSCSAFVMLLGVNKEHTELAHHNTFFSSDYAREFRDIFERGIPPQDPTIYVSISSKSDPQDAPAGSENWFVQVNVPALNQHWDWSLRAEDYADLILRNLAARGFDIQRNFIIRELITPQDIADRTGAWRGALYGASSNNRWAAFRRIHNRSGKVKGLYFAGGTTHPGGGVPMAALSGRIAGRMFLEDYDKRNHSNT
jgi:phytoene desaturase